VLKPAAPLPLAERLFSNVEFPEDRKLIVAYSGGGDSTALLLLLKGFLPTKSQLVAVTVDHDLRHDSASEAARAGETCARHAIAHRIVCWAGAKPETGLQEAARCARFRLLSDVAAEEGAAMVLTGHTLDDQSETIAMRGARGEGRGLSGIAPATLYDRRLWFVRPLLAVSRNDLRTWLEAAGERWIEDPSNRDPKFERVRIRLSETASNGDAAMHGEAFEAREAEADAAADIVEDTGVWRLEGKGFRAKLIPDAAQERQGFGLALAAVLSRIGNTEHLLSGTALQEAVRFAKIAPNGTSHTVSGCLMTKRDGTVEVSTEARNTRETGYGFDRLLPLPDFRLASAVAEAWGQEAFPPPPVIGYPV
jgi:tRNA(Ile)-lysidine synthase